MSRPPAHWRLTHIPPTPAVPGCSVAGADHPVERARAGDLDAIADSLAAAFADYAWTSWIVPAGGRQERLRGLQALTTGRVGLPYGEVWVTRCPAAAGWGLGAYLETSSTGNVSLYERSGFRVIGDDGGASGRPPRLGDADLRVR